LLLKTWTVVAVGTLLSAAGLLMWLWPRRALREREPSAEAAHG
jgi:HAMP domain-containing protein